MNRLVVAMSFPGRVVAHVLNRDSTCAPIAVRKPLLEICVVHTMRHVLDTVAVDVTKH